MLIVYDSLTGNVRRFVDKLGFPSIQLDESLVVDEPYYLVTYTIGFGQVPSKTTRFLEKNSRLMLGVAASGNRNWGDFYGRSGKMISDQYNTPLIHTFELAGTVDDVDIFKQEVAKCQISLSTFS